MFFMILSIIGKVLLVILKILLFLLLFGVIGIGLVLFVPVRYHFNVSYYENDLSVYGGLYWLLHVLSFRVKYSGKETEYLFKIFGIKIFPGKEKKKTSILKGKDLKKTKNKETENKETKNNKEDVENKRKINLLKTSDMEVRKADKSIKADKNIKTDENKTDKNIINENREKENKTTGIKRKKITLNIKNITHIFEKIKAAVKNIINGVKHIYAALNTGKDKAVIVKEFVLGDKSRNLICFVRDNVLHLWRYIRPRYLRAAIVYGFDDPALTGQVLGVIAAFCGMTGIMPGITPDFEKKIFEGEIEIKGRIMVFVLLKIMVKVYLSEEIREFKKEYDRIREVL